MGGEFLVAGMEQLDLTAAAVQAKKRIGGGDGLLLKIEAPDHPTSPDQLGKKESVIAVAAGGVQHPVTLADYLSEKGVAEGHGPTKVQVIKRRSRHFSMV